MYNPFESAIRFSLLISLVVFASISIDAIDTASIAAIIYKFFSL